MKQTKDVVTRYEHGDYNIDIIDTSEGRTEAWIAGKESAISLFMFGMKKDQIPREEFLSIVESNLEDYISLYDEEMK